MPSLSEIASMQATPRNPAWGAISDFLTMIDQSAMQKQFGYKNPVTGAISEAVGIPAAARVANKLSYNEPITNVGKANVPLIPEDTADAAMFAAPIASKYGKFAGKEAARLVDRAMIEGTGPLAGVTPQPMRIFAPAEKDVAFKAAMLEKKGLTPEQIHAELGVHRGVSDKQWRKELDDSISHIKGSGTFEDTVMKRMTALGKDKTAEPMTVGDVFHHSELFKNYPELKDIEVRFLPKDSKIDGRMAIPEDGKSWLEMRGDLSSKEARDVILHELQHPIQEAEGWAVGGSSADFKHQDAATKARDILNWRNEVEQKAERMGLTPKNNADWYMNAEQALVNDYHEWKALDMLPHEDARFQASWPAYGKGSDSRTQAEQLVKMYGLDKRTSPFKPNEMYNRLGGEVEARQVQARKDLNAVQRQQNFPGQYTPKGYGYDTPLNDILYLNREGYYNSQDLAK